MHLFIIHTCITYSTSQSKKKEKNVMRHLKYIQKFIKTLKSTKQTQNCIHCTENVIMSKHLDFNKCNQVLRRQVVLEEV